MEKVKVKAKLTGMHAVSGIGLVAGETYDIDRAHFGHEIMEPVDWTPTDEEMGIVPKEPETAVDGTASQSVAEAVKPAKKTAAKEEDKS